MRDEHMYRVSDIGGVILKFLRSVVFYWRRYHEDITPRRQRVQTLSDHTKEVVEL